MTDNRAYTYADIAIASMIGSSWLALAMAAFGNWWLAVFAFIWGFLLGFPRPDRQHDKCQSADPIEMEPVDSSAFYTRDDTWRSPRHDQ